MSSLLSFIEAHGYLAIFLVLAIESVGIPSPSEFSLLFAGYLVDKGQLHYLPTVLAAAAGSTTGAALAYYLGLRGGRPFLERYGRYLSLPPPRLAAVERWFARHGWKVVYAGRVISGVRLYVSYPAGAFGLGPVPFGLATVAGALTWPLLAVTVGMYLGDRWGMLFGWLRELGWAAAVVLVLLAVTCCFLHRRMQKRIFGQ